MHAGQPSIRQAYEALGVDAYYREHGGGYSNPHQEQISKSVAALLSATRPSDWLWPCGAGAADGAAGARAPPLRLRVLDLACGSGEATLSLEQWNAEAAAAGGRGSRPGRPVIGPGVARAPVPEGRTAPPIEQPPFVLEITACDPYTGAAYAQRTGRTARPWSFEDIADGCLLEQQPADAANDLVRGSSSSSSGAAALTAGGTSDAAPGAGCSPQALSAPPCSCMQAAAGPQQQPQQRQQQHGAGDSALYDMCICSFALHLCDPSRLFGTLYQLSLVCRWLVVLSPHKQPHVRPEHGWRIDRAMRIDRTHTRVYRSSNAMEGGGNGS